MSLRLPLLALLFAVGATGAGCTFGEATEPITFCSSDAECGENQVCFADGCGEPDRNVAVEITVNAVNGHLAQDFAVERLEAVQNFPVQQPAVIQGVVQVQSAGGANVLGYTNEVTFRASGESLIIPGQKRSLTYRVTPDRGAFQFFMPTGRYALTATPTNDTLYAPSYQNGVDVHPGDSAYVEITLPSFETLVRVDGRLVQTANPSVPVKTAALELQALDPVTGRALSQRVPVSSGHAGATGDFFFYMDPPEGTEWIELRATPKDATAMVPTKTFLVRHGAKLMEPLELGEFGAPVTVTGRAVATNGKPLQRAVVFTDGEVGGGGRFKSDPVQTDADGRFVLRTLPSSKDGRLEIWVAPQAKDNSGVLRQPVEISAEGGEVGDLVAPDKLTVTGILNRPDGSPAPGVAVVAVPFEAVEGAPLPSGNTETVTDELGRFTLLLDPATYRFDFLPTDTHPRVSRLVTIRAELDASAERLQAVSLPPFSLSRGRTVTGSISAVPRRLVQPETAPAPYASVKFFRVVTFGGKRSSLLLAETTADVSGRYSVVLPTR